MKRTWLSILVVSGVLGLLTIFVGLQYRWLTEASEAERERMQKRVETDTTRLAEDFNREMQAAYYNFQTGSAMWKNLDWTEFNERYDYWKERTEYPELIRSVVFLGKAPEAKPLRYDPTKRAFEITETTPDLISLRSRFTDEHFDSVDEDHFAMILPVYENEKHIEHIVLRQAAPNVVPPVLRLPEKFGHLVIMLDESVIKDRVLPDLAGRYFGRDYKLTVSNKSGQSIFATNDVITTPDASAPMFNMSPNNLLFFANRDAIPKVERVVKSGGVVVDQRVESHTITRAESNKTTTGTFQLELKQSDGISKPRTTMMAATGGAGSEPWTLSVQHTSGSINAFVMSERNRSFAIGVGIYLLLVGGILAIVFSAMRSKRFAQRQIDFVSSVSHEFRTPLSVIYSAGENLADGVATETSQVSQYGKLIKGEGKKLSAMVEQILEFAGANSGKQKYSLAPTDVSAVVKDALAECAPLIDSSGFTIETDLQNELPQIQADRSALSSAIQNLIANSVKYSNGSKWIKVSAANGEGSVEIAVEDRGIGIRSSDLRRIFEPFYRGREVVDAQISGNGLGLNLVKKIAEAHGGRVLVESKPGSGSRFTIEIPQG